jgi:glutathione S-transferase
MPLAEADVRLFGSRLSPFVEKIVRALQIKDVPFELVAPRSPADFRRWNPRAGKMPVLEVAGTRTYDSTFILRRLDELVPEPALYSRDPAQAARQRLLEDWSDEALYWYVMGLRWSDASADASAEQVASSLPIPAPLRPLVKPVLRRQIRSLAIAQGMARLPPEMILEELDRRFGELEIVLADSPFFYGESAGAADFAVFGQLRALQSGPTPEGAELLAARPALRAHCDRVVAATEEAGTHRAGRSHAA